MCTSVNVVFFFIEKPSVSQSSNEGMDDLSATLEALKNERAGKTDLGQANTPAAVSSALAVPSASTLSQV